MTNSGLTRLDAELEALKEKIKFLESIVKNREAISIQKTDTLHRIVVALKQKRIL